MSLYTPQLGEASDERLLPADREKVIADLLALRLRYPKLQMPKGMIEAYADAAGVAGRMRLRADDDDDLGRPDDQDHAVPVRRRARLRELRLHRVGRPGRRRPAPAVGLHSDRSHLHRLDEGRRADAADAAGRAVDGLML